MRKIFLLFILFVQHFAIAQFTDNFTDGDFTVNPAWTGSNAGADFTVTGGQLRSNSSVASSNFYLSTASTVVTDCQWEFWCNLQFNTSGANYTDVYLVSDQNDLQSASINGYFIRLGGTLDEICLYKRTGATGTSVKIIDGVDGTLNTSNNMVKIKVIRTAANLFTLDRDLTGTGTAYVNEGSVTDAAITTSANFGVFIQQSTASFHLKHFFDDFYAGPIILDIIPPSISGVSVVSSTQLDVLFSEAVDVTTSQTAANYTVNNSIGPASTATRDASNFSLVHLTFGTAFSSGLQNTITINNVQDAAGNAISGGTANFTYYLMLPAVFKDVIANEIMIDVNPVPAGVPARQYLELYNRSSSYFNLGGWQIKDGALTWYTIAGNYLLAPGTYVLIAKNTDTVLFTGIANKAAATGFPTYNLTGDKIYMKDNLGTYTDSVDYTSAWYNNATKANGGWSLELINPGANANCLVQSNWTASNNANGGTPGVQNSVYTTTPDVTGPQPLSVSVTDATHITVCFNEAIDASQITALSAYTINNTIGNPLSVSAAPGNLCADLTLATAMTNATSYTITFSGLNDCSGNAVSPNTLSYTFIQAATPSFKDVLINEIMVDVNPVPAGVPARQYLELYNRSSNYFNLNGWQIKDATTTWYNISGNYILAPNSYVLVAKNTDTALFTGIANKVAAISFPSYNVSGDGVFVRDNLGNSVDSINYTNAWYNDAVKANGGWSLELINPNLNGGCTTQNNWAASNNANGGSPGIQNSIYTTTPDVTGPQPLSVAVIDATHITLCFTEAIDATLISNAAAYSISGGIGTATAAVPSGNNQCVDLTLATGMTNAITYTVTLTGLTDCSGNAVSPSTISFTYIQLSTASFKDVIVNELMVDINPIPAGVPAKQYLELYNRSTNYFNLNGWQIKDATTTWYTINSNYILAPNTYVLIAKSTDTALFTGITNKLAASGFPSYNVTGDGVFIRDNNANYIDSLNYTTSWYNDVTKSGGGWSLELINPAANTSCTDLFNWMASTNANGGTPGIQNSVYSTTPDLTGPQPLSVSVTDATHITVCFNEALSTSVISSLAAYTISNGIGNAVAVVPSPDNKCADLTLGVPMSNATAYTITFSGLSDCSGNAVNPATLGYTYTQLSAASFKDVIVNEIMIDVNPVPAGVPAVQYLELYNRSSNYFNLNGWQVKDATTSWHTITGNYILAPNAYVIIAKAADTALFTGITNKAAVSSFPSYNITSDGVYLADNLGGYIDSLNYSNSWYNDAVKANGGWSLELVNPNLNAGCTAQYNWTASNDANGGTPGIQNSVYTTAPDVTGPQPLSVGITDATHITVCFTEAIDAAQINSPGAYVISNGIGNPVTVLASPDNKCVDLTLAVSMTNLTAYTLTFSGLADCSGNAVSPNTMAFTYYQFGNPLYKDVIVNELMIDVNPAPAGVAATQYIELYNRSSNYFNLNGWQFSDAVSTTTISSYYLLAPNAYVVLARAADTSLFIGLANKIGTGSFPSYNLSADKVILKDGLGNYVDTLNYTDNWYNDPNKNSGGWSLELINPLLNPGCTEQGNWTASSNANGGTPGVQNSVYNITPDVTAPQLVQTGVSDSLHVSFCFSEGIPAAIAGNLMNYTINNSIGTPLAAAVSSDGKCIDLTLGVSLTNQSGYLLTLSNFADCSGNPLSPNTVNFTYYRANKLDVLINEIMPDPNPTVGLPDQEYIELYNRTIYPVSLKNWTLSKSGSTSAGTIGDITILPDSFVVLMNISDTGNYTGTGIKVYGVSNFPSIDNATSGGKTIYLKNNSGSTISWVTYYTSTYRDANKSGGGYSLELIDPNSPCGGEENWNASNDASGGTPGRQNSVYGNNPDVTPPSLLNIAVVTPDTIQLFFSEYIDSTFLAQLTNYSVDNSIGVPLAAVPIGPQFKSVKLKLAVNLLVKILYTCTVSNISDCVGNTIGAHNSAQFALPEAVAWQDLVINEIMFDPNTGGQEWLEIYNRSDKTIDLYTILVGKYDTLQNAITGIKAVSNSGYLLFPQQYIVISENGTTIKSQYSTTNPAGFLDIPNLPALYTTDVVAISDINENVIDYVKYNDKMHFSLLNTTKGVSLEKIDFNRSGNDKTNWNSASSQVGFATPAYRNSQYLQGEGGTTVSSSPEIFSPDNDGYNDVVNINYEFAEAGKVGNISIYDSRGRFIRYLVKNELLGVKGTYSWNGIDQNNEKAPMGIYVIYFEVFDTGGKINKYKLTTVLGGKL